MTCPCSWRVDLGALDAIPGDCLFQELIMNQRRGARQHEVTVDGEACRVWIVQTGKVTWLAYGDFRGSRIEGKGNSEAAARRQWQSNAEYHARG